MSSAAEGALAVVELGLMPLSHAARDQWLSVPLLFGLKQSFGLLGELAQTRRRPPENQLWEDHKWDGTRPMKGSVFAWVGPRICKGSPPFNQSHSLNLTLILVGIYLEFNII